jgi:hypothetical protein
MYFVSLLTPDLLPEYPVKQGATPIDAPEKVLMVIPGFPSNASSDQHGLTFRSVVQASVRGVDKRIFVTVGRLEHRIHRKFQAYQSAGFWASCRQ